MKRLALAAVVSFLLAVGSTATAAPVLWYNGNFDFNNGLANEELTVISNAEVHENFIVPAGPGWIVDSIFSNNLMSFTGVTQAMWTIRSGVSNGNGGSIVAGGTSAATQTATGNSAFGLTEYTIEVGGLNVYLAPGTYWLNVRPVDSGSGRSFMSTTSGAGAIGLPAGNDGNSFFNSTFFGANFAPSSDFMGFIADFSGGIRGQVAPEPASLALFALAGGVVLGGWSLRRRKQKAVS